MATVVPPIVVRRIWNATDAEIDALACVLVDCVEGGASVSFMLPLPVERARAFWRKCADDAARGGRALLVAEVGGDHSGASIVGTVQVILDQPENQPHRADISKMLVLRSARGAGIGAALMTAAEDAARSAGKTVLVLDTANDAAERLYIRQGWTRAGVIPDYALLPGGGLCDTVIYYRRLG